MTILLGHRRWSVSAPAHETIVGGPAQLAGYGFITSAVVAVIVVAVIVVVVVGVVAVVVLA